MIQQICFISVCSCYTTSAFAMSRSREFCTLMSATLSRWNTGRAVGERMAFSVAETQNMHAALRRRKAWFELCLLTLGIDTMLRASDLLRMRVRDIRDERGNIRTTLVLKQQKTRYPVYPVLTASAQLACKKWLAESGKHHDDFVFAPKDRASGQPISDSWYRRLVKRWAAEIGLPPEQYSTHSLRRTKPLFLYHVKRVDITHISQLLGHNDPRATAHYLRLDVSAAQAAALAADIFVGKKDADVNLDPARNPLLEPEFLDTLAAALAEKVLPLLRR